MGSAEEELRRMRRSGEAQLPTSPRNPLRAHYEKRTLLDMPRTGSLQQSYENFSARERLTLPSNMNRARWDEQSKGLITGMRRTGASMTNAMGGFGGSNMQWTEFPQRDPWEYWKNKVWWIDLDDLDDGLADLRRWCRLMYMTHHLVPSLIDIYTRFPLLDVEFVHKDQKLVEFYNEVFWENLQYKEHLFDMGREFWVAGECFSLAQWHDGLGVWVGDEIINPDDVTVRRESVLSDYRFRIKPPSDLKKIIDTQQPREDYEQLVRYWPDIVEFVKRNEEIPVSDVLMKHQKFKVDPWSHRGIPILLRAFRQMMIEESLHAAQEGVAERLYSPLLLAQLGLDNVDDQGPWIPDPSELDELRNDLFVALNSDLRLMVYHHGLKINSVFGREQMPRFDQDFARVNKALMQVFGIGEELLSGGKGGPYASGALNRELITQMLSTYQGYTQRHMRERMEPVAERQEHYEYEKKGDRRIPIMETVLMVDEETGEEYLQERPKLAIPEVRFKSMNLRDEKVEREFLTQLETSGFPISQQTKAINLPIDFDEEAERRKDEKVQLVIMEQQFKADLFQALDRQNLPVPAEYLKEFQDWKALQEGRDPYQPPPPEMPGMSAGEEPAGELPADEPTGDPGPPRTRQDVQPASGEEPVVESLPPRTRHDVRASVKLSEPATTLQPPPEETESSDEESSGEESSGDSGASASEAFEDLTAPPVAPNIAPNEIQDYPGGGAPETAPLEPTNRPEESDEQRENSPRAARVVHESILDDDVYNEVVGEMDFETRETKYFDPMNWRTPSTMTSRVKYRAPKYTKTREETEELTDDEAS